MKKIAIKGKAKGLIEVLFSHFFVLFMTMLISFVLPLKISVEEYGRWQLFTLIIGYAGFFALGFNDGIHVNYSGLEYNESFFNKFRTFRIFIELLSLISTALALIAIFVCRPLLEENFFIYIISAFNIIPVLVNGFYAYVNQGTMRFGKYSVATVIEKLIYIVFMFVLIIMDVQNAIYYMLMYSLARYVVIAYNFGAAKELFGRERTPVSDLKEEIKSNYFVGFSLMIATLFNQSIIVPGRLIVENFYGIAAFSCYSFAIHTMVIANQITTSMSQVFYPAIKQSSEEDFIPYFNNMDEMLTLLSAFLLLSFYPAYFLIKIVYQKYWSVLTYLFILYPLFIYTSKSLILVINTYKRDANNKQLLINNLLGVIFNIIATVIAHLVFKSVLAIAAATLISYIAWYYFCYLQLLKARKITITLMKFADVFLVVIFILLNVAVELMPIKSQYVRLFVSFGIYTAMLAIFYCVKRNKCLGILKTFLRYLNK